MADSLTGVRASVRRALAVLVALALVTTFAQVAGADPSTKQKLDAAKAEFEQLKREIEAQQNYLNTLGLQAARIAERWEVAYGRWEQITAELRETQRALAEALADYQALRTKLEERARQAYITGPGSDLEFLLGATSLADLSARVEYVNALSEVDADLATSVQNLRNTLLAEKENQQRLQVKAAKALRDVEAEQARLDALLEEQQRVLDDLNAKKARAEELVERLEKRYKRELAALYGIKPYDGVFQYCPVDQPRAVYDGFGAPRYGGGYHPHAGNDIIAPQGTAIRATFDGYAQAGSNTLGGYSVNVFGALGYTYNAHLMQPGVTGQVSAGQVIGYVGETGDTSTPHDHFEWHPKVIPNDWPVSPYGYNIIGTAVNPFPLLSQVC
jgi:murein DD-endopeptidase MepM/ murein hydrolase activator NlpD